jgi:hypothetical protein
VSLSPGRRFSSIPGFRIDCASASPCLPLGSGRNLASLAGRDLLCQAVGCRLWRISQQRYCSMLMPLPQPEGNCGSESEGWSGVMGAGSQAVASLHVHQAAPAVRSPPRNTPSTAAVSPHQTGWFIRRTEAEPPADDQPPVSNLFPPPDRCHELSITGTAESTHHRLDINPWRSHMRALLCTTLFRHRRHDRSLLWHRRSR